MKLAQRLKDAIAPPVHPLRRVLATLLTAMPLVCAGTCAQASFQGTSIGAFLIGSIAAWSALTCSFFAHILMGRHTPWVSLLGLSSIVITLVFVLAEWPFLIRFESARADLERMRSQWVDGSVVALPARAGSFTIVKIERKREGVIAFWTEEECAFAFSSSPVPRGGDGNGGINVWEERRLDDQWRWVVQD